MLCHAEAAASFTSCENVSRFVFFLLSIWSLVNKTHAQLDWGQVIYLGQLRPAEDFRPWRTFTSVCLGSSTMFIYRKIFSFFLLFCVDTAIENQYSTNIPAYTQLCVWLTNTNPSFVRSTVLLKRSVCCDVCSYSKTCRYPSLSKCFRPGMCSLASRADCKQTRGHELQSWHIYCECTAYMSRE